MSLFLPSNLSPNFEEVFVGNSDTENTIVFSFQVNTNGSQIRSYKIEILNELNDEEDPDENILYTEYGMFGYPLYNKDFGYIYLDLTREVEEGNSMTLSDIIVPEKDYRWRVRLYEDEIVDTFILLESDIAPDNWSLEYNTYFIKNGSDYILNNNVQYEANRYYKLVNLDEGQININSIYGTTYIGSGNIVGTTKQVIWLDKYNDQIVDEDYVRTILYSGDNTNDYNPFNTKKTGMDNQVCVAYPKFVDGQNYVNEFEIKTNHVLPDYYDKLLDGNTYMSICNNQTQQSNDLQWEYNNKVLHIYGYGDMENYTLATQSTQPWYDYKDKIEQVVVYNDITSIGNYAFYNYKTLKTVIIPKGLKKIGDHAFQGCANLTSFHNNDNQGNKVVIPGTVQSVGEYAFAECGQITEVEIQEGVASIEAAAFKNCVLLDINHVSLPQFSVKNISSSTFTGTKFYNEWDNDDNNNVLYVGNYLIKAKTDLDGTYSISEGTISIAYAAFQLCKITNVTLPTSLRVIGQAAFQQCGSLTEINIPEGVIEIQTYAFYNCTSLNTIKIPNSVENIGINAFTGTSYYKNTSNWVNYALYIGNYLIKVDPLLSGEYTIVSGTKIIADSAFYRCPNLTKLIIPDSVINIGGNALKGCTGLTNITLPFIGSSRNVNKTSDAVFGYIFGSTAPSGSQTIQQYYDENYSVNYYIPSTLKTVTITNTSQIPYGAFYNCNNITSITIPDGVTKIDSDAFYNTGYYNLSSNWSSDGLYLNNNKALIKANTSFGGTYTIKPEVLVVADGAFDDVAISRMDPTLKRSYGAVWYNNEVICTNHPDREQYTPKLIESLNRTNSTGHSDSVILTLPIKQAYRKDFIENNCLLDKDGFMYCNLELVYIQRQQVYTVDKSIGNMQLSKLTLDEPLEYNTFHNTTIDIKLKDNNFARNRLYINSVREFDSKLYSNAYINLAYFEHELINTEQEYYLLTEEPDDWSTGYGKYYQLSNNKDGVYVNVQPIYKTVRTAWGPNSNNAPDNWDTVYNKDFYIINNNEYVLNDSKTWDPDKLYIRQEAVWKNNKYYKYRMSNIDISKYQNSAAVQQIINYVSDTGECSLFSDLPFLPDQFYMYQIFVTDKDAPNYDPSKSENPYKFFAGVGYNGSQITGVFDDGLKIFREDGENEHACYLGGGYGIVTSYQNRFESSYKSQVYSNHQIGETNQYFCFIQPNLAVKADDYKPCSLEIYDTQQKKTLYITNYNGLQDYNVEYNKDYSIDTLDDSQWLVTLTYSEDDIIDNDGILNQDILNDINSLIIAPQTKYKIYTNYIDSIPEGYFYCRNNKLMSLEYQDCYTGDTLNIEESGNYKTISNLSRDVLITCNIHDINNETKNYVSIKSYKYIIGLIDEFSDNFDNSTIISIQSQDKKYDGRLQVDLRGVNVSDENHFNLYRIQIEVEDELGYTHFYSEDVCFKDGGNIQVLTGCISTSIDYIAQTANVHINIPNNILETSTIYKILAYKQKMGYKNKQLITSISDDDLYLVENNQVKYDGSVPIIIDYSICNTNAYKYEVYVEAIDSNGNTQRYLLISDEYIRPMFKTWSICDLDFITTNNMMQYGTTDGHYEFIPSTKIFSIKNNIEIGEISDNLNIITYNTLGQFGRIIQNKQKFDSGSINCMISDMQEHQKLKDCKNITKIDISDKSINDISHYINDNSEYYNKNNYLYIVNADSSIYYVYNGYQWVPVDSQYSLFTPKRTINEWRNFVSNGKLKLLKSPDGYIRIVAMSQANNYSVDYKSGQYPAVISFNWQEMMDSDQIIIAKGE